MKKILTLTQEGFNGLNETGRVKRMTDENVTGIFSLPPIFSVSLIMQIPASLAWAELPPRGFPLRQMQPTHQLRLLPPGAHHFPLRLILFASR